jgi:hypothetical protein
MKSKSIIVFFLSLVSLCNAQDVYLYTPNGSQVYAYEEPEMSSSDIAYYNAECASSYPNAEILATASATYNCHSYAWNLTEGGTTICHLDQFPDLHLYWDDGSYQQTTEANAVKIFYYEPDSDHSAVISTTHAGKYESKWGSYPLVRHSPEYGPYTNMQNRRYYRPTPVVNFTNQIVTTNTTIVSSGNINVQNVTVKNGAKLTLDAVGEVNIIGDFEVELGSEFEIIYP